MVLVVAYNAENTIASLLKRIPEEIWEKSNEILVSDDSSQDNTTETCMKWKKANKKENLKIIKQKKNLGYGGNQKFGYNYAIKKGYDLVIMLHGDVQYAPEDAVRLIKPLENDEADMVFGSRIAGNPLKGGMPFYKFLGNKFLTFIENTILRQKLTEYHSGFRLYSTEALKKIPFNLNHRGFHFDTQILIQLKIANLRIKELPIETHYGDEKCYVKVVPYGLNILKELCKYLLTKNNLKKYKRYDKINFRL